MPDVIFDKKNVLVTGGAGFIGSHLCEELLEQGANVICLDNFVTSQEQNIDHLLRHPSFEFIKHDITQAFDPEAYPELARFRIKFQGIQEIYNLACPTSPKKFEQYRMQTLYANSVGVRQALDLALRYKARVVHASSSVIYGPRPADGHRFVETENGVNDLLSPRACYDEGKRWGETICATYKQVHGLDIRIARIFRTYGPRMPLYDGQMIPDFITNALEGKDLEIFGDESFRTSLMYVSDLVQGMIKLMTIGQDPGPINFGSDIDIPLVDVATRILEMTGSAATIKFSGSLLFMSELGLPDLGKARETLGWIPLITLDDGLKRSIDYTISHKSLLGFQPLA